MSRFVSGGEGEMRWGQRYCPDHNTYPGIVNVPSPLVYIYTRHSPGRKFLLSSVMLRLPLGPTPSTPHIRSVDGINGELQLTWRPTQARATCFLQPHHWNRVLSLWNFHNTRYIIRHRCHWRTSLLRAAKHVLYQLWIRYRLIQLSKVSSII